VNIVNINSSHIWYLINQSLIQDQSLSFEMKTMVVVVVVLLGGDDYEFEIKM
jgi:type III secretory pathway component EscS